MTGSAWLAEVVIADPPERWEALGFSVEDRHSDVGGVRLTLGSAGQGIVAWALRGIAPPQSLDGLATSAAPADAAPPGNPHPNGAVGLDHVVVITPDFDRSTAALEQAGMPLRRIRDVGSFRQGFRRLGPTILELVEAPDAPSGPARFWGLVVIVEDLDALARRLGDHLGPIKSAVQPGRSIATLRSSAGLSTPVAFMDPESSPSSRC